MKTNRNLKQNDEAVSPVIGVILMVAITVILAAVIGAFVFGMSPPEPAPQASMRIINVAAGGVAFTLEHQGGDDINTSSMYTKMMINGEANIPDSGPFSAAGDNLFSVGQQKTVTLTNATVGNGDKVTLIDVNSAKLVQTFTIRL